MGWELRKKSNGIKLRGIIRVGGGIAGLDAQSLVSVPSHMLGQVFREVKSSLWTLVSSYLSQPGRRCDYLLMSDYDKNVPPTFNNRCMYVAMSLSFLGRVVTFGQRSVASHVRGHIALNTK